MPKYASMAALRLPLFVSACLILAFQAGASRMLKVDEAKIGVPGLHGLPFKIDRWQASNEESIGPEVEAYLKPDEYVLRDYAAAPGGPEISLFVAYFKSLENTYGPHSPRICLPGAGWIVSSSEIVNIPVPGHPAGIPANRFTMEKSNQRILVLYWYQNDRDVWAEEYHAKLRLLPDLIRYRRSDVSLVRLITTLNSGSSVDKETANCARFTEHLFPDLAERFASVSTRP